MPQPTHHLVVLLHICEPLRISLSRLILCTAAIAVSFALFARHGAGGIVASAFLSIGLGGIAIVGHVSDWKLIVRTAIVAIIGASLCRRSSISEHSSVWDHALPAGIGAAIAVVGVSLLIARDKFEVERNGKSAG